MKEGGDPQKEKSNLNQHLYYLRQLIHESHFPEGKYIIVQSQDIILPRITKYTVIRSGWIRFGKRYEMQRLQERIRWNCCVSFAAGIPESSFLC